MADATRDFFEDLTRRGHEPLLEQATGRIAVELAGPRQTQHWLVEVDEGDVAVSHEHGDTDCTIRTSEQLFDGMVRGEVDPMAGLLRGAIEVEGDPELLVLFQRVFPGPPADWSPGQSLTGGQRRSR